jgi:tetratricopeptide (TPR) repeat protein
MTKRILGLIVALMISSSFLWAQDRSRLEALTVEADTLMNRQDFDGALKILTKIIKESKLKTEEDYLALYNRAICYFSLGDHDLALKDVNQYLEKFQEQHAILLRLYIYQEQGKKDLLLQELSKLSSDHPDNVEFIQWRIDILMEGEEYALARKDIRKLMALQSSPQLTAYLGMNYYYDDQPDSALIVWDEALQQDHSMTDVYIYAASLCVEEEAYGLALNYIDRGLKHSPSDTALIFYKGIALVETSKLQEGCRCLNKAFAAGEDGAIDYLKEYCYGLDD